MKKQVANRLIPMPYTLEDVIDRVGALTLTVGAAVTVTDENATILYSIAHSDTKDGTFEQLDDPLAFNEDHQALVVGKVNVYDIDLSGTKQFIRISAVVVEITTVRDETPKPLTATATYAAVLSDLQYSRNIYDLMQGEEEITPPAGSPAEPPAEPPAGSPSPTLVDQLAALPNTDDVKKFALAKGIDITGLTKRADIEAAIIKALEGQA